jgi:hypothetical protein
VAPDLLTDGETAPQMDVLHPIPLIQAQFQHGLSNLVAGGVDQHVDLPLMVQHVLDETGDCNRVGDVTHPGQVCTGVGCQLLDGLLELSGGPAGDDDVCTGFCQRSGHGATNAAAATRD